MRLHKKRPQSDMESQRDSVQLPRFSFESETEQRLISTERLFFEYSQDETEYSSGRERIKSDDDGDGDISEIVVRFITSFPRRIC